MTDHDPQGPDSKPAAQSEQAPAAGGKAPAAGETTPAAGDRTPAASRWSTDTDGPSETAKADAMGATVLAYLLTGPALFGAIGYGLDKLLGTGFIVAVGIVAGMGLSLYTIWLRYGTT